MGVKGKRMLQDMQKLYNGPISQTYIMSRNDTTLEVRGQLTKDHIAFAGKVEIEKGDVLQNKLTGVKYEVLRYKLEEFDLTIVRTLAYFVSSEE